MRQRRRDYTSFFPPDEKIRQAIGGRPPQNFWIPLASWTFREWLRLAVRGRRPEIYPHETAERVRSLAGRECWDSYFKFSFERNPWDKAVSLYHWHSRNGTEWPSFSIFLREMPLFALSNYCVYSIKDRVAVDQLFRFEDLTAAMNTLSQRFGVAPETLELPQSKTGYRPQEKHYPEYYNEEDRQFIEDICRREIELCDYSF